MVLNGKRLNFRSGLERIATKPLKDCKFDPPLGLRKEYSFIIHSTKSSAFKKYILALPHNTDHGRTRQMQMKLELFCTVSMMTFTVTASSILAETSTEVRTLEPDRLQFSNTRAFFPKYLLREQQ